jgi:dTDP-glucose pyrophosphorylase
MIIPAKEITIAETTTIREALGILEKSKVKFLMLVDKDGKLTGTCTDGDFRRKIIASDSLDIPASEAANATPISAHINTNLGKLSGILREQDIKYLPLVSESGVVEGLYVGATHELARAMNVPVVIMAGGLGRRLMPLTETCPKPLLMLGDKPILEHIIMRFREQGFRRFYISINYLGHMIEEYFGTGQNLGVEITYLREHKRLGTGGALHLLPQNMSTPFLVVNGDVITETNYNELIESHLKNDTAATMCIREHFTAMQFGVVKFDGNTYLETQEKPTLKHHINTGVYCLSKDALSVVPDNQFYDMPTMFQDLKNEKKHCSVHVIRGSWLDIGTIPDFEAAQKRFSSDT